MKSMRTGTNLSASATNTAAKITTLDTKSVTQFISWLSAADYTVLQGAPEASLLHALKTRIMTNLGPDKDRSKTIDYLNTLVATDDNYLLFHVAAEIIVRSKQIWHLNGRSLNFFHELYEKNRAIFNELIDNISKLCEQNALFLQSDHIDTIIASLFKQKELPASSLAILDCFLDKKNPAIEEITQALRAQHQPEITLTAKKHLLIHHDIPHALEIKTRTMHVTCETLGLLATDSKRDLFLRTVAGLMVEFHDLVQVDKGEFKSVELATTTHILEWLTASLTIEDEPNLKKIIEFMADQIIVLGTTMVFSRTQTTDLSQLYLMLEEAAIRAGCLVAHESNRELIQIIRAIMLITGVCDKNPSAVGVIANMQYKDMRTSTLAVINRFYCRPLLLNQFFATEQFSAQYSSDASCIDLAQQRFLITLVPHLCMSAELNKVSQRESVITYIEFINLCRRMRPVSSSNPEFKKRYDKLFNEQNMTNVIDALFFNTIEGEIAFSRSQVEGLRFVSEKLLLTIGPMPMAELGPLIDLTVPRQDVENLGAFKQFYDKLSISDKNLLINEMLLVVVFQPGTVYAHQPEWQAHQRSPAPAAAASRIGNEFFSSVSSVAPLQSQLCEVTTTYEA